VLDELPAERPAGVKANDIGGPLKEGFVPPPAPGFGLDGKPVALPASMQGKVIKTGPAPETAVRPREIRVQSAVKKPVPGDPTPTNLRNVQ